MQIVASRKSPSVDRGAFGRADEDDSIQRVPLTERDALEKPQCAGDLVDVRPRIFLGDEM